MMIKQKFALSILLKLLISVIGFASSFVVARYMGPEPMGVLSSTLAYIALFTIFGDFGFGIGHYKRVSEGVDLGKCIGVYSRIRFFLSILVSITALLGYHLTYYFTGEYPIDYKYYNFFLLVLGATFFTNFFSFIDMTFTARTEIIKGALVLLANKVVNVITKLIVAFAGLGVIFLAWSNLVSSIFGVIMGIILFRSYPIAKFDKKVFKSYMVFALPLTFVNIIETISYNIDKVFIGYFIDLKSVGYYAVAQSLTLVIIFPADVIYNLLVPTFTKIISAGNQISLLDYALKVEKYISIMIFPFTAFLVLNSSDIIALIYGKKFQESSIIFAVLAVQSLFFLLLKPYTTQMTAMEKLKPIAVFGVLTQFLNIIFNLLLIPKSLMGVTLPGLGALGSALSLLLCTFFSTLFYRFYLAKKTGMKFNPLLLVYLILAIISSLLSSFIFSNIFDSLVFRLLFTFIFSLALFFLSMVSIKLFNRDDYQFYLDFFKVGKAFLYAKSEFKDKVG